MQLNNRRDPIIDVFRIRADFSGGKGADLEGTDVRGFGNGTEMKIQD